MPRAAVPGYLLFWATDLSAAASIDHTAMYLADGMMIVTPHTGDGARVAVVYTEG